MMKVSIQMSYENHERVQKREQMVVEMEKDECSMGVISAMISH